jgi:glucan phosphoethanolaminetransferase (alkaline phosphatase superfamily)
MSYLGVFLELLKDRQTFLTEIHERVQLKTKISALLLCSFCCFAVYGAIIGSFHSFNQAIASSIKLPALYLLTLIVCLPALYIFNVLFGSRKTIAQHFTYILSAAAVISLLLCGFAPVILFFLITISPKEDYSFFLLLNVAVFSLTGVFGVSFLYQAMRPTALLAKGDNQDLPEDLNVQLRSNILRLWLILYGFVGSQLGWTLRPFFGTPTDQFQWFRPREGNFVSGVWNALMNILTGGS